MATKKKLSEKDSNDYKKLLKLINNIYINQGYDKKEIPFVMLTSQIKNMLKDNKNYSYSTIRYTLKYMYKTLELNLFNDKSNGSILALLPYYYIEAGEFCNNLINIKELIEDYDFNDEVKVSKIGKRNRVIHNKIDINDL